MKIKGQLWNYEEQVVVPEYDHEYLYLSLYGQYKFTESSLFRMTMEGYSRRYGDRPAFDLDGAQRAGNPNIRYDYYSLQLTARQRILDSMWFGFDIKRTERTDKYVGYNDYTRDSVRQSFTGHQAIASTWKPAESTACTTTRMRSRFTIRRRQERRRNPPNSRFLLPTA